MSPSTCTVASTVPLPLAASPTPLGRALKLLTRKRVLLTRIAVPLLIAQDIFSGIRPHHPFDLRDAFSLAGMLLVTAGLVLRSLAAGTLDKTGDLAVGGPYRMLRNPLYVGSYLLMCGFCALLGDLGDLLFVLGPLLLVYWLKVQREEHSLAVQFGHVWQEYAGQTPRFLPQRLANPLAGWRARLWLKNGEWLLVVASLAGLVALAWWHGRP